MIDSGLQGMSWMTLPAGTYTIRKDQPGSNWRPTSHCQIECDVAYDKLIAHEPEGEWSRIAPLRILSFDIECAGRKGVFPEAEKDPVIQIANTVTRQGDKRPFIKNVFNLGTCSQIVGAQVRTFAKESDLLLAWRDFVNRVDPDIIIGYNIANFDLPYLVDRAKALQLNPFMFLGRLRGVASRVKDAKFSSKAYGTRESKETTIAGRV